MGTLPKFDIDIFFQQDADDIFGARKKGKAIHRTKDIDAAGDEIELPVKEIIKKRLPQQYYVGQGHIVDSDLNTSGQFDIMIADNKGSPILFSSQNNTDYLTYESIYAVGEIKSTYYKNKPYVKDFIEKIKNVNEQLVRTKTPPEQITQDLIFNSQNGIIISSNDTRPYKNPLLKFMLFVDSNDLDVNQLGTTLLSYENVHLPNVIYFLDKGVLLLTETKIISNDLESSNQSQKDTFQLGLPHFYPEFIPIERQSEYKWTLCKFEKEYVGASTLAHLIYILNNQLRECMLLKPDLVKYHSKLFRCNEVSVIYIKPNNSI
ncbi:MAG: hypothetical protein HYZ54_08350 [Ignavibacteriae bacterium]|nr:hypothetical protein [Ignavibacteriota bacterium]